MPIQIPETIQIKGGNTSLDFGVARALRIYNAGSGMSIADLTKTMANSFTDGEMPKSVARAVALNPLNFSDDRRTHGQVFGGVIKNPHTTAFFDGVQLRSYALTWKMSARSQNESDRINEILQTIRERILPEERYEGYALDFPDLVYVDFEGESKEYLPKYYKSFISDLTINTSSGDGMVFYKSGAPVTVEISCTFMETNIMTRNVLRGNSNG
ncbi:MAG: hypothetical protein COA52_00845 [Hyphomicrobiales bacterium]|nr:MAG: hypothetical protein COA52_00845 [Hyphomicrobiales bacterium]